MKTITSCNGFRLFRLKVVFSTFNLDCLKKNLLYFLIYLFRQSRCKVKKTIFNPNHLKEL